MCRAVLSITCQAFWIQKSNWKIMKVSKWQLWLTDRHHQGCLCPHTLSNQQCASLAVQNHECTPTMVVNMIYQTNIKSHYVFAQIYSHMKNIHIHFDFLPSTDMNNLIFVSSATPQIMSSHNISISSSPTIDLPYSFANGKKQRWRHGIYTRRLYVLLDREHSWTRYVITHCMNAQASNCWFAIKSKERLHCQITWWGIESSLILTFWPGWLTVLVL